MGQSLTGPRIETWLRYKKVNVVNAQTLLCLKGEIEVLNTRSKIIEVTGEEKTKLPGSIIQIVCGSGASTSYYSSAATPLFFYAPFIQEADDLKVLLMTSKNQGREENEGDDNNNNKTSKKQHIAV